jgi:hypothetical protein
MDAVVKAWAVRGLLKARTDYAACALVSACVTAWRNAMEL